MEDKDRASAAARDLASKVEAAFLANQTAVLQDLIKSTPRAVLLDYWDSGEALRLTLTAGNVELLKLLQAAGVDAIIPEGDDDAVPSPIPLVLASEAPLLYNPISKSGQDRIRTASLSNWTELRSLICTVNGDPDAGLEALEVAINKFSRSRPQPWDFYTELLPRIKQWALEEIVVQLPMMLPHDKSAAKFTTTPRVARHVLANAFFLNIALLSAESRKRMRLGELSFYGVYNDAYGLAPERVERVVCQLAYLFKVMDDAELDARPPIVFERRWPSASVAEREEFWRTSSQLLPPVEHINVHANAMEDSTGKHFVDFANKFIHIGSIIPSLTQEEVLFSCCPEAFLCLLFIGELQDREVLVVRNIQRCSTYTGYLNTFRWTGLWPAHRLHDILVIDACLGGQFKLPVLVRDLEKAYLSFAMCNDDRISTGHWGCGVFGGEKTLKFIQQLCAAAVANARLDYSTYRDEPLAAAFRRLHAALVAKGVTVGQIVQAVPRFLEGERRQASAFAAWIAAELKIATQSTDV